MAKFRYVGKHADSVKKGDKCIPVGFGDFVDLTNKDLENPEITRMVGSGSLVPVTAAAEKAAEEVEGGK